MKSKKILIRVLLLIYIMLFVFSNCFSFASTDAHVDAPVALLIDSNSGKVLYEKNAYEKMYPASTTKMMTAILALENCELSDIATVSYDAIFTVPVGYSNANLQLGEELTVEQLLYVLLIPSANDAANVLAEHISGSVESFATMMNTKAVEIGCKNTHFVNANGVHDENHYSTAYDLALIGQYAMKNETFRKIVSTSRYTLPVTNKYDKEDRIFNTTNFLVNSKSRQYYEYATGIKTGYTVAAKNCIVAGAEKNDFNLICVILGADNNTSANKFKDCISLFNYGFDNYTYKKLYNAGDVFKVINPKNASNDTKSLNVLLENDVNVLVNKSDFNKNFSPELELNETMSAPISKGDVIGKISYTINDIKYTTNLIAGQDIESSSTFIIILKIFAIVLILYILKALFSHKKKKTRGKKSYSKKSKHKKKSSNTTYSPYKFNY